MMLWYGDISAHEHRTAREAESCCELYAFWQEAMAYLMTSIREEEIERQVNMALQETAQEED
jgi:hypothetical protein